MTSNSSVPPGQWQLDSALYLDYYVTVCHLICGIFGITINIIILAFIVGLRRLHLQRTFTWLGIGFSNCLLLAYNLMEIFATFGPSPLAGKLCGFLSGWYTSSMMLNWFLSLVERYLCLKHSNWHRRHITSCWIILAGQAGCFAICLAVKSRNLIFSSSEHWKNYDLKYGYLCFTAFVVGLVTLSIAWLGSIRRHYLPAISFDQQLAIWHIQSQQHQQAENGQQVEIVQDIESQQERSPFVIIGGERVSRLDLEAARSIFIIFLVLLILTIPMVVSVIRLAVCLQWDLSLSTSPECKYWVKAMIYSRTLVVIHCFIIGPAIFVFLSRDFRSALRDRGIYWI